MNKVLGLGLGVPVEDEDLDAIEAFYDERGIPMQIELCPLASAGLSPGFRQRGYQLQGFENQLARRAGAADRFEAPVGLRVTRRDRDAGRRLAARRGQGLCGGRWLRPAAGGANAAGPDRSRRRHDASASFIPDIVRLLVRSRRRARRRGCAYRDRRRALGISGTSTRRRTGGAACSRRSSPMRSSRRRARGPGHRDARAGQHLAAHVRALRLSGDLHACDLRACEPESWRRSFRMRLRARPARGSARRRRSAPAQTQSPARDHLAARSVRRGHRRRLLPRHLHAARGVLEDARPPVRSHAAGGHRAHRRRAHAVDGGRQRAREPRAARSLPRHRRAGWRGPRA